LRVAPPSLKIPAHDAAPGIDRAQRPIVVAPQNEEADVRKLIKRTVCAVAIMFGSLGTLAVTAD
jgi:hypothetical protein